MRATADLLELSVLERISRISKVGHLDEPGIEDPVKFGHFAVGAVQLPNAARKLTLKRMVVGLYFPKSVSLQ